MSKIIRAARLVRVSTGKQAKDDRTSLPYQTKALTEICERNGWLSLEEDLFVEVISGAKGKENREAFTELLRQVAMGKYQRVCVLDFDRSTRKGLGEWEEVKGVLVDAGCKIVINGNEYDLEDEDQELSTDLQAVIAKRERQMIRRRTIRGQETKAEAGEFATQAPFGYRSFYPEARNGDRPKRMVELDPEAAETVRLAFELYSGGVMGYTAISDELNAMGRVGINGQPIDWMLIYRLIRNPTYAGLYQRRRPYTSKSRKTKLPSFTVPSKVFPPIVSLELWERCQAIKETKPKSAKLSQAKRRPLSGILRCNGCGGPMMLSRAHDTNANGVKVEYFYYKCYQKIKRLGTCEAPQNIRLEVAHQAVINGLLKIYGGVQMIESADDGRPKDRELELKAQLYDLDREEMDLLARLKKPLEDGGIREDQFRRYNQQLLAKRDSIESELKATQRKGKLTRLSLPDVASIVDELTIDDPRLNDVVRSLFREIRLVKTGQRIWKREWSTKKPMDWVRLKSAVLFNGLSLSF